MAPYWDQPNFEPISGLNHWSAHFTMGPAQTWTNNRIEPFSGDPLSGLDCTKMQLLFSCQQNQGNSAMCHPVNLMQEIRTERTRAYTPTPIVVGFLFLGDVKSSHSKIRKIRHWWGLLQMFYLLSHWLVGPSLRVTYRVINFLSNVILTRHYCTY